ncbi:hypothetical protein PVAP13_1KG362810, partial [Panicum virgatum]
PASLARTGTGVAWNGRTGLASTTSRGHVRRAGGLGAAGCPHTAGDADLREDVALCSGFRAAINAATDAPGSRGCLQTPPISTAMGPGVGLSNH